jgi:hypothetical protein
MPIDPLKPQSVLGALTSPSTVKARWLGPLKPDPFHRRAFTWLRGSVVALVSTTPPERSLASETSISSSTKRAVWSEWRPPNLLHPKTPTTSRRPYVASASPHAGGMARTDQPCLPRLMKSSERLRSIWGPTPHMTICLFSSHPTRNFPCYTTRKHCHTMAALAAALAPSRLGCARPDDDHDPSGSRPSPHL